MVVRRVAVVLHEVVNVSIPRDQIGKGWSDDQEMKFHFCDEIKLQGT